LIDVRLPEVFKVEFLGKFDDAGRWTDVKCTCTLALSFQGVPGINVRIIKF
jgi:hypothetical protein